VLVVAASNSPEMIDAAFFRAGRLDACLLVDVPRSDQERLEVLRALTARMRLAPDADLPALAAATDGFTGADLAQLCARAGLAALQENVDAQEVAQRHLSAALAALCPSAPPSLLRRYRAWRPNRSGHQEEAYPDPTPAHSATGAADPSEVFGTRTVNRNALVIHF
jgi:SpoVK/Ycf46/Vps4 family AAA+-type ATPase